MAYTKTNWLDRAVQFATRYLKSGETSSGVTLTADPGTVTQAGTPVNAANLNKLEQGVYDAHMTADAAVPMATFRRSTAGSMAAAIDKLNVSNLGVYDNRNVNDIPSAYPTGLTNEFKAKSAIGLSAGSQTSYAAVQTYLPYSDATGYSLAGYQLAYSEGAFYQRQALDANTWGSWFKVGASSAPEWLADLDTLNSGVDGAYAPGSNTTLVGNAIYRYTSLNIPVGVTVSLSSGQWAIILVDGDATINGTLTVSGRGAAGGGTTSSNAGLGGAAGGLGAGSGGGGGGNSSSYQGGGGGGAGGAGPDRFDNPVSNTVGGAAGTYGAAGGAGASYGAGPFTGGAGGNSTINLVNTFGDTSMNFKKNYGAGGGGGSNNFSLQAGSGGAGGGVIIVIARNFLGTGAIRADGLSGGNASTGDATYGAGGGGGGGGGMVITAANSYSSLTLSANGGAGGLGYQASTNKGGHGGAGGNGVVFKIKR